MLNKENIRNNRNRQASVSPRHIKQELSFRNLTRLSSAILSNNTDSHKSSHQNLKLIDQNQNDSRISRNSGGQSLAQAFSLQRESLMSTLAMYKQQIDHLTQNNSTLKKQLTKTKSVLKEKTEENTHSQSKIVNLQNKVEEYRNILPKLGELEQLQENLIRENSEWKGKVKVLQAILGNIAMISRNGNESRSIQMIQGLTEVYYKGRK